MTPLEAEIWRMKQGLPELIETNTNQKNAINESIVDLQLEKSAINSKIMVTNKDLLEVRLEVKRVTFPVVSEHDPIIVYGATYDTNNISDWAIQVWDDGGSEYLDAYVYEGIGWDSDEQIITYIGDYSFGYDWIHHDPALLTGTYGIQPLISALQDTVQILNGNIIKFTAADDVLERALNN